MKQKLPKKVRWGIIGPGRIAHKFATDLLKITNCELYGVASRNIEVANDFAQKYNAKIAFNSYEELANCDEVDAVYIATPHSFHKEHSILCLKNKKAVLCEKPLAMNSEEVEEMITIAKENDTLLMEALWTYFLPHYDFALRTIESQKYGKVVKLESNFSFYTPYSLENRVFIKQVGGGSLLDIGIYTIFAALSTLGFPNSIEADATFFENGADATCQMKLHYKNVQAYLSCSLLEDAPTEAVFHCEDAIVRINSMFNEPSSVTIIKGNEEITHDFPIDNLGFYYEIEHFNQLLREGKKESDKMTFDLSKNIMSVMDIVRDCINLKY